MEIALDVVTVFVLKPVLLLPPGRVLIKVVHPGVIQVGGATCLIFKGTKIVAFNMKFHFEISYYYFCHSTFFSVLLLPPPFSQKCCELFGPLRQDLFNSPE